MKTFITLLLLLTSSIVFSQEPWRTLTFTNTSGSTIDGEFMSITSANISYELTNDFSIESWTGFNYNFRQDTGWLSSQATINKTYNSFKVGVGLMYNSGFVNIVQSPTNQTFGVVTISKRFKL